MDEFPDKDSKHLMDMDRRIFLRSTGLGIIGVGAMGAGLVPTFANTLPLLPAPIQLPEQEDMTTEPKEGPPPVSLSIKQKMGFAIVGLGQLALNQILPAFAESKLCKPVALVSGNAEKAKQVADQYGIDSKAIYDYGSYEKLADNPDVQVIYIVLPNSMHAEFTIRGAKAGKHILCEKPMATSSEDCQKMIAACRAAQKKLMIAYRIQYEPHHRKVMAMIQNQKIGQARVITLENIQHQANPSQWRLKKSMSGGGCLPDIGLYCLNTARFLLGEEPSSLTATTYSTPGNPLFTEVEEEVSFLLSFPSGAQALCSASYNGHSSKRYRVVGTKAWLEMDPAFPYKNLRLRQGMKDPDDEEAELVQEHVLSEKNQFALEMDHMAQCVSEDKQPHTPGEEGLKDQKLMEAIYKSAEIGTSIKFSS